MKIRTVIMFIAGGSLALPHIARTQDGPPRVELTSYYRQSFLYGSYERQGTLWTYDDYFELDYRTNSIYEHWEGNYPDPHVRGGWYTGTWPGLGVAGWLERYLEPSVAWPWPTESAGPTDPFDPNGMIFLHNGCFVVQHEDYFLGGDATEDACETSTIHLFTGHSTPEGTPGKVNLHRLRYTVRDRDTGFDVDHSQITMLVYAALPDDTAVDVTPSVTGSYFSTTYSVEHQWASLVLRDQLTGQHVTDQTNVVWVGERIHLSCSLSAQIAIVTNFQWTVPGKRIANWDVAADGRYARTHALTGIGTNGPTVQFHWVLDQAGTVDVVCKVQVEGETLTAKTTYEIRRPTASWNLYPQDVVQVTTNCWVSQPAFAGYYHLTTGKGWGITNYGMYYVGYMDDLKGYPSNANYSVSFVQLVSTTLRANMETTNAQSWIVILKAGLDTSYPYVDPWPRGAAIVTDDTPKSALQDTETYYWRTDGFASYLMWKSERRAGSIPVPLRVAHWDWYGAAQKLDRNSPPTWRLNGWTNQRAAVGVDTAVHPKWEFIVNQQAIAENKIFNNFTYATP